MQLFVLDDADYDTARDVLSSLQVSGIATAPTGVSKRFLWFSIVLSLFVVIALVATIIGR